MSGIKLLRTIRFDGTDDRVFALAAQGGEWAVSGAFAFADLAAEALTGRTRQAFAGGFLGVESFGRSTFVTVAEAAPSDRDEIVFRLAMHFVARYGAPDIEAALPSAGEEVAFMASLAADAPINTLLTVHRVLDAGGHIKEQFRTIKPPASEPPHARIWKIEPDET
ncbi:MAG: DUF6505 family protein [Hyphomicrobiaceae bacterium]|nr:DUF6505 family protein [Hyphomicrobiaceae bacterium]